MQSDTIDGLLEEYHVDGIKKAIDDKPRGRLFKAREWMNHYDTQGAREIIRRFRDLGLDPPQLVPVERVEDVKVAVSKSDGEPPFIVTMGLGFSKKTDKIIDDACSGWLRVNYDENYGDVLEVLENFVPNGP